MADIAYDQKENRQKHIVADITIKSLLSGVHHKRGDHIKEVFQSWR